MYETKTTITRTQTTLAFLTYLAVAMVWTLFCFYLVGLAFKAGSEGRTPAMWLNIISLVCQVIVVYPTLINPLCKWSAKLANKYDSEQRELAEHDKWCNRNHPCSPDCERCPTLK